MKNNKTGDAVEAPWNFSWVVRDELAAFACPGSAANLRFLSDNGVRHLVTLSRSHPPPPSALKEFPEISWTLIDVEEFEPPSLDQMLRFVRICELARPEKKATLRMGRGRTGVMAACYLVRFCDLTPARAISNLRLMRPGSVETYTQEKAVSEYFDHFRSQ